MDAVCRKTPYPNRKRAERAMHAILKTYGRKRLLHNHNRKISAYECAFCGHWHFGNRFSHGQSERYRKQVG